MAKLKIALLTAGGLAPCLSAALGALIQRYTQRAPGAEIIGYRNGYQGVLTGRSIPVTAQVRARAEVLLKHGGSPLGNSRVSLANAADCVKRGFIPPGADPLKIAAEQLRRDGVTILHTIGGDDTNTVAGQLAAYLARGDYSLTVVGLPKTVDNDIAPIRQTLGAITAAEQGARFFRNVVNEQSTSRRMLLVHEIMGRDSGSLTASTARAWRQRLAGMEMLPEFNLPRQHLDIDAVYLPEMTMDLDAEAARLKRVMEEKDSVILFVGESACAEQIVDDLQSRGEKIGRDAFGHIKLDDVNAGEWFASQFGKRIGAEKRLVQKSGYFARSAPANAEDLRLIGEMADLAVDSAFAGHSGVIGHDEENGGILAVIDFARIKGGKRFNL
ncbi:MAG: pyrophosphate--fructose-6-phosphate 1-phosphotransferase, partial [Aestuariivirgaceae bacterium]